MAHFCAAATGPPGRLAWGIFAPPSTMTMPRGPQDRRTIHRARGALHPPQEPPLHRPNRPQGGPLRRPACPHYRCAYLGCGAGNDGGARFAVDEDGKEREVAVVAARERLEGAAVFRGDVGGHSRSPFAGCRARRLVRPDTLAPTHAGLGLCLWRGQIGECGQEGALRQGGERRRAGSAGLARMRASGGAP